MSWISRYSTNAIFSKSKHHRNAGGKVLSNVLAFPIVRISCVIISVTSCVSFFASAHTSGAVFEKRSICFGFTQKSIFPTISVVSKAEKKSDATLSFKDSSRIFLYFIDWFMKVKIDLSVAVWKFFARKKEEERNLNLPLSYYKRRKIII